MTSTKEPIITTPIIAAYGDGIGSEIMDSVLTILREAGANITIETIEVGERIYNMGAKHGILPSSWDTLRRNKILLKSPIIIPKSVIPEIAEYNDLNDIIYKRFNLSADNLIISNMITMDDTEWLSGSSNIGEDFALFETIHDSAPDIAGKNIANPSGIIQAAIMMMTYIEQTKTAALIQNAWLKTIDDGIHTADMYGRKTSKQKVSTSEFTEAVIERLGQKSIYSILPLKSY